MCPLPVEKLSCHVVEYYDYCDYYIVRREWREYSKISSYSLEIEYNLASIFDGLLDLA